jgi:hypothetical protein
MDAEPTDFEGHKIGPTVHDACLQKENQEFREKTRPRKKKVAELRDWDVNDLDLDAILDQTKIVRLPYADADDE